MMVKGQSNEGELYASRSFERQGKNENVYETAETKTRRNAHQCQQHH